MINMTMMCLFKRTQVKIRMDSVSVASGEAPAVLEFDAPLEVPKVQDVSRRMDGCDGESIFLRRALAMRTVLLCICCPCRAAMRVALVEATSETMFRKV